MRIDNQGQGASAVFAVEPPPARGRVAAEDLRAMQAQMAAIARGDEAALKALYRATVSRVHALALRILGDPAAAEEAVSDVYYQIWRTAGHYDAARGNVVAYLMTICRSRALDLLRRRDRHLVFGDFEVATAEAAPADPRDLLESLQEGSAVRRALAALSPMQRQILALAFYRGLTHSEIAGHTGMPLGTVKTTIRRTIQCLREHMAEGGAP